MGLKVFSKYKHRTKKVYLLTTRDTILFLLLETPGFLKQSKQNKATDSSWGDE